MKNKIYVFDNKGRTFDRYTVILPNGDIYGCSDNPSFPNGFGMFIYNINDEGTTVEHYVETLRKNPKWLGEERQFECLPQKVQTFINQKLNNDVDI